jgi:hypothetical protein
MSFDEFGFYSEPTAIIGDAVAGRPEKVRLQINALIKGVHTSTIDLAELLHETKTKNYFEKYGFNTFGDFAKELGLKTSKSYYLVRIIENMKAAGIPRSVYETVDISKLRAINKLDPADGTDVTGTPIIDVIKAAVTVAQSKSLEDVQAFVAASKGLTDDEAMVWSNFQIKKAARDNVVRPALDLAKKQIGSVGKNDEGVSFDASDGRALEAVCADFLSDPNNAYDGDLLKEDN